MEQPAVDQHPRIATRRSGLAVCAVLFLLLGGYLLSWPWACAASWRLAPPADQRLRDAVNAIYAPVVISIDHNRAAFVFYRWYTQTLNETFPSYFEIPILLIDPQEIQLIQIDPPP